jgi:hypothetical protein
MIMPADSSNLSVKASALLSIKLLKPIQEIFPQTEKQDGGIAADLEH